MTTCALAAALVAGPAPRKRVRHPAGSTFKAISAQTGRPNSTRDSPKGSRAAGSTSVTADRSCAHPQCHRAVAEETDADFIVQSVVSAQDRTYEVTVVVHDAQGTPLAQTSSSCEVCGVQEVREIVSDQAAQLRTKLDGLVAGPPVVVVDSVPPEATVIIDGKPVGTTPLRRPVTPGRHVLRADKDGFIAIERRVCGGVRGRREPQFRARAAAGHSTPRPPLGLGWRRARRGVACRGHNVLGAG